MHRKLIFCGIDLAGSEKRITGIAFLNENLEVFTQSLYSNEEILKEIEKYKPTIIAIDAPLSLPKGRKDIEEKNENHYRKCDLELRKYKIRFFPITLGPMRMLTKRGIFLKNILEEKGYRVIETFPGAFYDIFRLKRKDKNEILKFFEKILKIKNKVNNLHEADAITCAYIAYLFYENKAIEIGDKEEGTIVIPNVRI